MKTIIIKEIPKSKHRYDTAGDYRKFRNGYLIEVSKDKNYIKTEDDLWGVVIHELVEMLLCLKRKINFKDIDKWDIEHLSDEREPGEIKGCPYYNEHKFANKIENLFLKQLKKYGRVK